MGMSTYPMRPDYKCIEMDGLSCSSTNKTDRQDITKILLKVALNTVKPNLTKKHAQISEYNTM
jgi:hypothetical protein